MTRRATLLTKADCALCEQAKEVLRRLEAEGVLELELVDLHTPEGQQLAVLSGMAFPPGLLLDGDPFSYGRLSERRLRRELARRLS
ncbi:MAG: glutaredoxin family protein [Actinomycetota bacterium]|nr:glutaredoxin family protein [Actinomycetota bacterium]